MLNYAEYTPQQEDSLILDTSIYTNVVMVPFDDESITWSISFIHQDIDALNKPSKKFIDFILENVDS